jgi:hypothetical protein
MLHNSWLSRQTSSTRSASDSCIQYARSWRSASAADANRPTIMRAVRGPLGAVIFEWIIARSRAFHEPRLQAWARTGLNHRVVTSGSTPRRRKKDPRSVLDGLGGLGVLGG